MAGKRMLHKNICISEKLSKISYGSECLYYRLLTNTDDLGHFFANPYTLKDTCFPLRRVAMNKVNHFVRELESVGLIFRYKANNVFYLGIVKFEQFQKLRKDRPLHVVYPLPSHGKPLVNQMETIGKPEVKVKVKGKGKVGSMQKPTLQQIQSYILERGGKIKADTFFNYYEANGWKVGRNPMKDWKAAIRHWETREYDKPNNDKSLQTINRAQDFAAKYGGIGR